MNKKVKSIQQNVDGVMIRCVDNTNYHGDILVGADGAYSAVRQSLYKQMDDQGLLPKEDKEEMNMAYLSIVGTTGPLDPEKYPILKDTHSYLSTVLSKNKPHAVGLHIGRLRCGNACTVILTAAHCPHSPVEHHEPARQQEGLGCIHPG
jgi:hypothetical protein